MNRATPRAFGRRGDALGDLLARFRRLQWEQARTQLGRVDGLRWMASIPVRALRVARKGVREYGDNVERTYGISRRRQLLALWRANTLYGHSSAFFYRLQLYLPDRAADARAFLSPDLHSRIVRHLQAVTAPEESSLVRDKRRFAAWCAAHGLPAAAPLATFAEGALVEPDRPPLPLPETDLFSKPTSLSGGRGARLWYHRGGDAYQDAVDGTRLHGEEVLTLLAEESREGAMILQPRLRNHAEIAHLTNGSLCTARVVTYREVDDSVNVLLAAFRMPVGDSHVDNFDHGGLAAAVDLETGRLSAAVQKDVRDGVRTIRSHPDSGCDIEGSVIPYWEDAKGLALTAHRLLPSMKLVAWDVGITDRGPLFVEGNWVPCCYLSQMTSGVPLGRTRFADAVSHHLAIADPRT